VVEKAGGRGTSSSQDVRRAESVEALSGSHVHRHAAAPRSSPFSKLHIPAQLSSLGRAAFRNLASPHLVSSRPV